MEIQNMRTWSCFYLVATVAVVITFTPTRRARNRQRDHGLNLPDRHGSAIQRVDVPATVELSRCVHVRVRISTAADHHSCDKFTVSHQFSVIKYEINIPFFHEVNGFRFLSNFHKSFNCILQ